MTGRFGVLDHMNVPTGPMVVGKLEQLNDFAPTLDVSAYIAVGQKVEPEKKELTGGRVNYYLVEVKHPQRETQVPYNAECEDIIQALNMTFDEGCIFKALWRSAAARLGNGKPGLKALYDAEKIVHYAGRNLKAVQRQS